jgi:ABC-type branched-subunit amino acid transport system substrate-binding protein
MLTLTMRERAQNSKIALPCVMKTALIGLTALMVTACTTVPMDPAPRPGPVAQQPDPQTEPTPTDPTGPLDPDGEDYADTPMSVPGDAAPFYNDRDGMTMPHMAGRDIKRLALLLPFSAQSPRLREEANAMFEAAELALFQRPDADIMLTVLDTKGTEDGARSAARAALQQGADVILGPIIAGNVRAASEEAARSGTPLLAFSNDQSVAERGRYLVSFPPESEVDRIVNYAATTGVKNFAFFGPDDAYGRRVRRAYYAAVARVGGEVTAAEMYKGDDISVMQDPARRLAEYHREGRQARDIMRDSFEAILLPEGGTALRSLAPLLPFYGIDPSRVLFMGTSRWDNNDTVREPALNGGVFAASDKEARETFLIDFERAYGDAPTSLASLAYDAVQLGAIVADGDPRTRIERVESPLGFYGADGYLRFGPDGRPDRGLAVYRIREGQFRVVDPAPRGPAPES